MHLTPKQMEILSFISDFARERGFAPSQSEIAKHFGFKSLGAVQNYLVRLEREGALQKEWNGKRRMSVIDPRQAKKIMATNPDNLSVKLLARHTTNPGPVTAESGAPKYDNVVTLPLLGRVAAGRPIEAITNDDKLEIPKSMLGFKQDGSNHYVLKVVGDSMIEDGILEGDFVIVQKSKEVRNGQTVVAMIDNEATVKRYYKRKDRIELEPANSNYKTIIVGRDRAFSVEGVVVGVIRKFN